MHLLRLVYKYLLYRLKSFRLHGVHSPFVFNLYQQVILHDGHFATYTRLEKLRQKLLNSNEIIQVTDYGAGSHKKYASKRTIAHITRTSAKSPKYAQLLFRLVNHFQPDLILELGTSLGITTNYLAQASQKSEIITLEGCPNIAQQAAHNFKLLAANNIKIVTGNFEDTLQPIIKDINKLDFVYFDGNHQYAPTIRYFETCLLKINHDSVFVFDDIYWSAEMEKAWQKICQHPDVTLSIDLFQIGLIFFRPHQPKQHFTLYF